MACTTLSVSRRHCARMCATTRRPTTKFARTQLLNHPQTAPHRSAMVLMHMGWLFSAQPIPRMMRYPIFKLFYRSDLMMMLVCGIVRVRLCVCTRWWTSTFALYKYICVSSFAFQYTAPVDQLINVVALLLRLIVGSDCAGRLGCPKGGRRDWLRGVEVNTAKAVSHITSRVSTKCFRRTHTYESTYKAVSA